MRLRSAAKLLSLVIPAVGLITIFIFLTPAQSPGRQEKPKRPWLDKSLSPDKRADLVIKEVTLDEKISLLHGSGWTATWEGPESLPARSLGGAGFIPGIPRLGVPDLQLSDAAVGVTRRLCPQAFPRHRVGTFTSRTTMER